jgi:hypothetical protein
VKLVLIRKLALSVHTTISNFGMMANANVLVDKDLLLTTELVNAHAPEVII